MVLHELEGFTYATTLDPKMAITTFDWIKTYPKSVPLSFLGANILPQEFTMETAGSPNIF
jgi:hypothetical protein